MQIQTEGTAVSNALLGMTLNGVWLVRENAEYDTAVSLFLWAQQSVHKEEWKLL